MMVDSQYGKIELVKFKHWTKLQIVCNDWQLVVKKAESLLKSVYERLQLQGVNVIHLSLRLNIHISLAALSQSME